MGEGMEMEMERYESAGEDLLTVCAPLSVPVTECLSIRCLGIGTVRKNATIEMVRNRF